jgi:hypothetical protein
MIVLLSRSWWQTGQNRDVSMTHNGTAEVCITVKSHRIIGISLLVKHSGSRSEQGRTEVVMGANRPHVTSLDGRTWSESTGRIHLWWTPYCTIVYHKLRGISYPSGQVLASEQVHGVYLIPLPQHSCNSISKENGYGPDVRDSVLGRYKYFSLCEYQAAKTVQLSSLSWDVARRGVGWGGSLLVTVPSSGATRRTLFFVLKMEPKRH